MLNWLNRTICITDLFHQTYTLNIVFTDGERSEVMRRFSQFVDLDAEVKYFILLLSFNKISYCYFSLDKKGIT